MEMVEEDARNERKQELYTAEFKTSDLRRSLNKERSTIAGLQNVSAGISDSPIIR